MDHMLLQEGELVEVKNASLFKATHVKLQPHTTDFLDISNPKAMLVVNSNGNFVLHAIVAELIDINVCLFPCFSSLYLQLGDCIEELHLLNYW